VRGAFLKKVVGSGKRVLDIGCRDGALTSYFREGNEILGLDIDASALARAQKDLGIEVQQTDLNGIWGIEKRSYDVVVAAEILEHLYYPATVILKVAQVLKRDAVFVGSVPNAFSLVNRFRYVLKRKVGTPLEDPTHINHFTVRELQGLLEKEFATVEITGYGRLGWLAHAFPQTFAYGLFFAARTLKSAAI
jgi:2-polyprenyl-3-methyl-5-hydroxy-6-metoxy-1,4-benzoquinol methylase